MKKRRSVILFLAITLIVAWILAVFRLDYFWVKILYGVILFPCGLIEMLIENYSIQFNSSHFLNNEIVEIGLFVLFNSAQGYLYYLIYTACKRRRSKKE